MSIATAVRETAEFELEYVLAIELDSGEEVTAVGPTIPDALRALADNVARMDADERSAHDLSAGAASGPEGVRDTDARHLRCGPAGPRSGLRPVRADVAPGPRPLPSLTPLARAEGLDVERLAKALHDQGFGCNAYRCSLGRGSSADAHEQDARFLADAYREADR